MDKGVEASGGREPPTIKESGVLRGTLSSSEAAERNRVRAARLQAVRKDLPVFPDGRGRPAKNRLAGLPRIPEEEGESLPSELPEVDTATEARLLEENPPEISCAVAEDDGLQLHSEAAVEELHQLIADRQAEGEEPRQRWSRRPEPLGQEGTLEVTDPDPPLLKSRGFVGIEGQTSAMGEMEWDDGAGTSSYLAHLRSQPLTLVGVRNVGERRNITPAGFMEDEGRREAEERAGTGRRRRKKSKRPGFDRENIESTLFSTVNLERPVHAVEDRQGRGERFAGHSRPSLPVQDRCPALRAARRAPPAETRRADDARSQISPAQRQRGEERQEGHRGAGGGEQRRRQEEARLVAPEPPKKTRRAKWLGRGGCRVRGSQFGKLVHVPLDLSVDPPPYVCFNCRRPGHGWAGCTQPRSTLLCFNCGRWGVTVRSCPRCATPHRAFLANKKEVAAVAAVAVKASAVPEQRPNRDICRYLSIFVDICRYLSIFVAFF